MVEIGNIKIGSGAPLVLISGPCVIEDEEMTLKLAGALKEIAVEVGVHFIFKASFDKANRSSISSFRGPGLKEGLRILKKVKEKYKIPVLSDIHCVTQVEPAAKVLDVIQIPAFLCRQTDLIVSAARTMKPINVKKGQFMSPVEMKNVIEKITSTGNTKILLTERGTTFGYNNLVVDMRSLPIMRQFGYPVIFDATHSVQLPGAGPAGALSGGNREFIPYLARAAVACGCDGIFLEVHEQPDLAKSDAANSFPLKEVKSLLTVLVQIHQLVTSSMESSIDIPEFQFEVASTKKKEKVTVYIDGCAIGNPGDAAIAVIIKDSAGTEITRFSKYIGVTTNNVAEYTALIEALKKAKELGYDEITVISDSELIVKQVKGEYKVKHPDLIPLYKKVTDLKKQFGKFAIQQVSREQNKEADTLAYTTCKTK